MAKPYKRGNTWYIDYRIAGKRIRKAIGRSKKMADLAAADMQLKIDHIRAGFVDPRVSLADFFSSTSERISRMSPRSGQRYTEVKNHFKAYLEAVPNPPRSISEITSRFMSQYATDRRATGLNPVTVNYELRVLHSYFLHFVRTGQLRKSPVADVQRFDVHPKTPRYLTQDEIIRLFAELSPRFRPYYTTLLYTGMRREELLNLTWEDVANGVIYVRPKKNWRPKSKSSIRQIPMHPEVQKAIAARKAAGESDQLIFPAISGLKMSKNVLNVILHRAAKRANVQDVTLHTFRHTFASHLVQNGYSIYIVSKLLGHSSVTQTEIYAHLAPSPSLQILIDGLPDTE
jgi:integrase